MASIVCSCGKQVEPKPEWAGQWIVCPGCAGSLYSPFPGPKPSTGSVAAAGGFEEFPPLPAVEPTRLCPLCAETIPAADPKCKFCGGSPAVAPSTFAPTPRPAPPPAPVQIGDGGVASLIVSIVGWMLCGALLCPIGWLLASNYEAACRRAGVEPAGAGKAGKIIGIIGTVFLLLEIGFIALCLVVG